MINVLQDGKTQFESLLSHTTKLNSHAFKGSWSSLEIQPDIFSPQKFIIGVILQPVNDRLHFKLLDDYKKFECVYGDKLTQTTIREMLSYAEHALRHSVKEKLVIDAIQFDTENLSISTPKFTSGSSCEATVERLFDELVAMAPNDIKKGREFESIDTNKARKLVNEELKRIASIDYEKIVLPEAAGMLYEDQNNHTKHYLDFNLLTRKSCGSVVSAVYKSPQTIEINLLRTTRDLTTYSRIKNINEAGVFLLLPNRDLLAQKEYVHIENIINEQSWKLERDGFHVVSLESHISLAKEVYDWALPTLSQ